MTSDRQTFETGQTSQFRAVATYSDGTTSDVTSWATWTVADTSVATVDPSGLVTGTGVGRTGVTARVSSVDGTLEAIVTEAREASLT